MDASQEGAKKALISEIEENIQNASSSKNVYFQDDGSIFGSDSDSIVAQESLKLTALNGIDPFSVLRIMNSSNFLEDYVNPASRRSAENFELIESHIVQYIETLANVAFEMHPGGDGLGPVGSALSVRDRLLLHKIPSTFILKHVSSIPDCRQGFVDNLSSILLQPPFKLRKQDRSKGETDEKLSKLRFGDQAIRTPSDTDYLHLFIMKSLAEASLTSLLLAVCVILQLEDLEHVSLPVGRLLGALFRQPLHIGTSEPMQLPFALFREKVTAPTTSSSRASSKTVEEEDEEEEEEDEEANVDDEDLSEEELLAQALALSMDIPAAVDVDNDDEEPDVDACRSASPQPVVDLSYPTALADINAFCTLGPLCSKEVWESLCLDHQVEEGSDVVSGAVVAAALLTLIGISADQLLGEKSIQCATLSTRGSMSSILDVAIVPNPLSFALVEHLFLVLRKRQQSDSQLQNYVHLWGLHVSMKLLRSLLAKAVRSGEKLSNLGLEMSCNLREVSRSMPQSSLPPVLSLLLTIADGMDMCNKALFVGTGDLDAGCFPVSVASLLPDCQQNIRFSAFQTFRSGLQILIPQAIDRDSLLLALLQFNSEFDVNSIPSHRNSSLSDRFVRSDLQYLLFELIQGMCSSPTILAYPSRHFACVVDKELFDDKSSVLARLLWDIEVPTPSQVTSSVEMELIRRCAPVIGDEAPFGHWAELLLLRAIQAEHIKLLMDLQKEKPVLADQHTFSFSAYNCNNHLELTSNNNSAKYVPSLNVWATVRTENGIFPDSGVHYWQVQVDRSEHGDMFLGIVTRRASLSVYIGGDEHGWGIFGTKSVWHNRSKAAPSFSVGFKSNDLVQMKLDTTTGSLFVRSGSQEEWVLAFSGLPKVTLYPAISLRNVNEKVTIFPSKGYEDEIQIDGVQSPLEKRTGKNYDLLMAVAHFEYFFAQVDSFLVAIKDTFSTMENEIFVQQLMHPFIGICLPSLVAAVSVGSTSPSAAGMISLRLLPSLTVVLKRLCEITSHLSPSEPSLVSSMAGRWIIKSGGVSSSLPSQVYLLDVEETSELELGALRNLTAFRGNGYTGASEYTVEGILSGSDIHFEESWAVGGQSVIDARLSLSRCHFCGTFRDIKSGKVGPIEGFRQSFQRQTSLEIYRTHVCSLFKILSLCSFAVGKLAGYLIDGLKPSADSPMLFIGKADEDGSLDGGEASRQNSPNPLESDHAQEGGALAVQADFKTWAHGELLSGGLPLSGSFAKYIVDEIARLCGDVTASGPISSKADSIYGSHFHSELLNHWVATMFPERTRQLNDYLLGNQLTPPVIDSSDTQGRSCVSLFLSESDADAILLDEFFQSQTSLFVLGKIGGPPLINARRLVLAALIRHTGTGDALLHVLNCVKTDSVNAKSGQVCIVLQELWRAAHKIVQEIIRQKQLSRLTISALCQQLDEKANFLLEARASQQTVEMAVYLKKYYSQSSSQENPHFESEAASTRAAPMLTKICTDVVKFLQCSIKHFIPQLRSYLACSSLIAVSRIAGFRTLQNLFQDQHSLPSGIPPMKGVSLISVQPFALASLSGALFRRNFVDKSPALKGKKATDSGRDDLLLMNGHYLAGLAGTDSEINQALTNSFENLYEFVAQLLNRCVWNNDFIGQFYLLSCWSIRIAERDHMFLNRVNIFKVLQGVLDNARSLMATYEGLDKSVYGVLESSKFIQSSTDSVVRGLCAKLANASLKVVHTLSSQVAFCFDPKVKSSSHIQLQRLPSGPDTLSQALFDLLFSELFFAFKDLMNTCLWNVMDELDCLAAENQIVNPEIVKPPTDSSTDFLKGEEYIYRILRLLHTVSVSKVCQKVLSSSKWLSLLLSAIGFGGIGVQRRLFRLLRRLLATINPDSFNGFVPGIISPRHEVCLADSPFEEDDIAAFVEVQQSENASVDGIACCCQADRLVVLLLNAVSIDITTSDDCSTARPIEFFKYLKAQKTVEAVVSEALSLVRVLQGVPSWRLTIDSIISRILGCSEFDIRSPSVPMYLGALSVNGGLIERIRIGGFLNLSPLAITNMSDPLSHQLSGLTRGQGLVVDIDRSKDEVEMVFIERHLKNNLSSSSASISQDEVGSSNTTQHLCAVTATVPIVAIKVNRAKVVPVSEIPAHPDYLSPEGFNCLLTSVQRFSLSPAFVESVDNPERKHTVDSTSVKSILNMMTMRAFSFALHQSGHVNQFINSAAINADFSELIKISQFESKSGNVCDIESLELRWASLWDAITNRSGGESLSFGRMEATALFGKRRDPVLKSAAPSGRIADPSVQPSWQSPPWQSQATPIVRQPTSRPVDPAAVSQMVEMGLPKEWCEVALRKCRNNVEMAINMCFENGPDMARLAAEESMRESQAAPSRPGRMDRVERTSAVPEDEGDLEQLLSLRGLLGRSMSRRDEGPGEVLPMPRSVAELGCPPQLWAKALEISSNDVTMAHSWIMSQRDEMTTGAVNTSRTTEEMESLDVLNPLTCISGSCEVDKSLTCLSSAGFPSVGCKSFAVASGKWYYEVTMITAGCVQLGWADCAFTGNSDAGQGVGDDAHSWAFDGWRVCVWHEISADWGAKWDVGDVVGCSIDMDAREMYFYLNGLSIEVDMGLAFASFASLGGVYPCASFSRKESIRFNFGSSPFRYSPPEGFHGFIDHVHSVIESNRSQIQSIDSPIFRVFKPFNFGDESNRSRLAPDDSFEECREESDWKRRYFNDSKSSKATESIEISRNHSLPSSSQELSQEFVKLSKDLITLYSRVSIMRILRLLPNLFPDATEKFFSMVVFRVGKAMEPHQLDVLDQLLVLLKSCASTTSRTNAYKFVISSLARNIALPFNLGEILASGGAPLLNDMDRSIGILFEACKEIDARCDFGTETLDMLINKFLDHIKIDTALAVVSDFSGSWKAGNGFTPVLCDFNNTGSFADHMQTPSLTFAVWMTNWIIYQLASDVSENTSSDSWERIGNYAITLTSSWVYVLRASNVLVKTCACRMLSILLQEFTMSSIESRFTLAPAWILRRMADLIPIHRLKLLSHSRISAERGALPVVSEYLQALLELTFSASQIPSRTEVKDSSIDPWGEIDHDNPCFDWEAASGRLMSENGWITWTGTVSQLGLTIPPGDRRQTERQHDPPELMPGCKVARPNGDSPRPMSAPNLPSSSRTIGEREKLTAAKLLRSPSTGLHPSANFDTSSFQIGEVVSVCTWRECRIPGSARVIRWDHDGSEEVVRWGADGCFDVQHLKLSKDGKVVGSYPSPCRRDLEIYNSLFGEDVSFGVILRLRELRVDIHGVDAEIEDLEDPPVKKLIGFMEWPDFSAVVQVTGSAWADGRWTITEKALQSGVNHAPWGVRFGHSHWRPGTVYYLNPSRDPAHDSTDKHGGTMVGNFDYLVKTMSGDEHVVGDILIQRARLFSFDEKTKGPNSTVTQDKNTFAKSGGGGQTCIFGNIGFSSGVHYWEFKIEQAEAGSIFLGVAEKPFYPGASAKLYSVKCSKWMGYGLCNNRVSLRSAGQGANDRLASYGDHFHTGDVVGVQLDMNRGRLSFFLDGLKFGEHNLSDLGEAFDQLSSPFAAKPRTLFPIVGLQRNQDRVTITPRWLSTVSIPIQDDVSIVGKAWRLLTSWSLDRPSSTPFAEDLWTYRAGWREWLRLQSGRFVRVKTRCRALGMQLVLDTNPIACVEASIRLGLMYALFRGDRILFSKSFGRHLDIKEEAIILGSYNGKLWYRLESQQGDVASVESGSPAWFLSPSDVDGLTIIKGKLQLPSGVVDMMLPRIPDFQGGLLFLSHSGGAVLRNGTEIDHSEVIANTPAGITVFATERRVNSSNIARFRILFEGKYGWISERMRGGGEEIMLSRVTSASASEIQAAAQETELAAREAGITEPILRNDVPDLRSALDSWEHSIREAGFGALLDTWSRSEIHYDCTNHENPPSLDRYMSLASTMDGSKNWSVEADMQLSELISKQAHRMGVSPQNLPMQSIEKALSDLDVPSSLLFKIDLERGVARAALLRVANQVFSYTLPYLSLGLPEEKWRRDVSGIETEIEIAPRYSEVSEPHRHFAQIPIKWSPPCGAKRLRALRRLLFTQTKTYFWDSILDATSTPTPLQQDEYEDPREIKTVKINRVKANSARLATLGTFPERFGSSVFGQVFKEMRGWSAASFRRAYLSKGHGGQKRAFKVSFLGEGVNDYGGPYRAVFEQIADELQTYTSVSGKKIADTCLLPLMVPCSNKSSAVGSNQDKFVFSTAPSSPAVQEYMTFFGKLVGTAVRHNLSLGLNLSSFVWRPLSNLPVSVSNLESIDTIAARSLGEMHEQGTSLSAEAAGTAPEEWTDMNFVVSLPDGSRVALIPNGEDTPVTLQNWRTYCDLVEKARLRESEALFKSFRDGLAHVLPIELVPLFTAIELEQLIAGSSKVDISLLKQCVEYENVSPDDAHIQHFWEVVDEMSDEERTSLLKFVWARSRMPSSLESLPMNFKIQGPQGLARDSPDDYLPHAQTCFFSLSLPCYSSKEVLRVKLLYAINNSPNMDADVRLHSAEGWADV